VFSELRGLRLGSNQDAAIVQKEYQGMPVLLLVLAKYERHPRSVGTIGGHIDKKRIRVTGENVRFRATQA
jgi:hypothetical protein